MGIGVGMALGLSLTSENVVWVLVDLSDRTVADHDSVEVHADTEIAHAAARGAHAIAAAGGLDLDCVRLTWADDVAQDGLRLRSRLSELGFPDVRAVPLKSAGAVMVDPDLDPRLALAYGAALAHIGADDTETVPSTVRPPAARRRRRAMLLLGAAALAAVGGLLFTPGSPLQVGPAAATAEQPTVAEPGWISVPAPSDSAATMDRKVVAVVDVETPAAITPVQDVPMLEVPVQEVSAAPNVAPDAEPTDAVEPAPLGVPHLPAEVPHLGAPQAEAAEALAAEAPAASPAESALAAEPIPTEQPHLPPELLAAGPVAVGPAGAPGADMTDSANLSTTTP